MGSIVSRQKWAAKNAGLTYEQYLEKRAEGLKRCVKCKTWKPLHHFGADRSRGDGLKTACFDCVRVQTRKRMQGGPPSQEIATKAIEAVRTEIRNGRMLKPEMLPCADCGEPAAVYHHHLGYAQSHWLDVIALCKGCHRRRHFE